MFQGLVRKNRVDELLRAFPECSSLGPDRNPLELPLQLPDRRRVALRISLPSGFPREAPALSLTSQVNHPWVDKVCRVNVPSLANWSSQGSLVSLVTEAKQGLEGNRGLQHHQQQPGAYPFGSDATSNSQPQRPHTVPPTPLPNIAPFLSSMGVEELNKALVDADEYRRLLDQIVAAAVSNPDIATLRSTNTDLAAANIAISDDMFKAQSDINLVRATGYTEALASYQDMCSRQDRVRRLYAPEALMQRLQSAVETADSEARELERRVHRGDISVEDFVPQYIRLREVYHQRDLKYKAARESIPMDAAPPRN